MLSKRKRRHRSRRALGAAGCSKLSFGSRRIIGIGTGAAVGAALTFGTWYIATRSSRALQKAAGAPAPTPGLFFGLGATAVALAGGAAGYHVGMRKPICS
jgi:hypothetical protein